MFIHLIKIVQFYTQKQIYKNKLAQGFYYNTEYNKVYMLPNNIIYNYCCFA